MGQFGNKFRQTREKKQLSLEDVSKVLKISARMLEAIEEENFDLLPGGIFNKGFIRSYAQHLELDPEEAVADYLSTLEAQIRAESAMLESATARSGSTVRASGAQGSPKSETGVEEEELPGLQLPRVEDIRPAKKQSLGRRSEGTPWSLISAAAIVIVLGLLLWIRHTRNIRAAALPTRNISSPQPAAPAALPQAQPVAPVPKSPPAPQPHAAVPRQKSPAGPALSTPTPAAATESTKAKPAPLLSLTIRATE